MNKLQERVEKLTKEAGIMDDLGGIWQAIQKNPYLLRALLGGLGGAGLGGLFGGRSGAAWGGLGGAGLGLLLAMLLGSQEPDPYPWQTPGTLLATTPGRTGQTPGAMAEELAA
ncbi:MAG: hypothetical protein QGI09_09295, partial [Dehalococcoidia bacterium]|nr:hypothetical protein [Dehalococcoidia bacterium]